MISNRTLLSAAVLAGFSFLAAGSSPELAEELNGISEEFEEIPAQPTTAPTAGNFSLSDLRGRQIWVIDGDRSYCQKLETLGLVVECDPGWGSSNHQQIVIRCSQIPHEAAPAILDFLGMTHFNVDTYVTNPASKDDGECGDVYEIAIWFGPGY